MTKRKKDLNSLKRLKKSCNEKANGNFVGKITKVSHDQRLLKMYGNFHASNEIKSSIRRSIHRINNKTNKLITKI